MRECFVLCRGIGPKAEEKIRSAGILNWDLALEHPAELPLSAAKCSDLLDDLKHFDDLHRQGRLDPILRAMPTKEHWRVLSDHGEKASYFDIETDGLSIYECEPTVICLYHKGECLTYINGENLDDFVDQLFDVELLVSFNGTSFDVPCVQNYFNIPTLPCPHVDLRWVCHHKGYRGGLKSIEREMGIQRDGDVVGVDGHEAVILWQKWKLYGQERALDRLVHYCQADTVGLADLHREILYL